MYTFMCAEPHVDNDSVITMLALLTPQSDFVGGINCFKGTQAGAPKRQNQLQCTDAVIFRGESLTHWITPVTAGMSNGCAAGSCLV